MKLISKKELAGLLIFKKKMQSLEFYGVDEWPYYKDALVDSNDFFDISYADYTKKDIDEITESYQNYEGLRDLGRTIMDIRKNPGIDEKP